MAAQERGFLGPGPVDVGMEHARGFMGVLAGSPDTLVDLGSGGGLPGLVLADTWADAEVWLVEANQRRAAFLQSAVDALGMVDRVLIVARRAEVVGRDPLLRARVELVVARGFGPPSVTAECAAPLLRVGGRLVVSEPPEAGVSARWPAAPLAELGLVPERAWGSEFHYRSLLQQSPCPDRYPRRVGVPAKRPLY